MLNLTENEKTTIASSINENYALVIQEYLIYKYPDEPYFEWLATFQVPNDVLPDQIQKALDNIAFRSFSENFETATPMGKFALQMMGAVGELQRNTIVENVKIGLKQRAKMGKHNSKHL